MTEILYTIVNINARAMRDVILTGGKKMNKSVKKLAFCGMFAAFIFVLTMFIKFPVASGYVHFGDALLYIASLILGPWGILAGAIGEGLADIAGSYVIYAPATVIIKAAVAVPFILADRRNEKKNIKRLLTPLTASMTAVSGVITVAGYFFADLIIDKSYAIVDIPGNVIQAVGSAVIFCIIAAAFDKADIKNRISIRS